MELTVDSVFKSRKEYQDMLGPTVRIKNLDLFRQACTHKSALGEYEMIPWGSYERIEFLGDAVLTMCITKYIFNRYAEAAEGFLTKLRTRLVSGKSLYPLAEKLGLCEFVVMSHKAMERMWNTNPRILEDVFESLIGAIFLDSGLATCEKFILSLVEKYVDFDELLVDKNFKDVLMRYVQRDFATLPTYHVVTTMGPDHNKLFIVDVYINGTPCGRGQDTSKKEAEQNAARGALDYMHVKLDKFGNLV